jgi:hypothetical protein
MKGRSAFAAFMCPTPLQDVPLDLTPTSGTVRQACCNMKTKLIFTDCVAKCNSCFNV